MKTVSTILLIMATLAFALSNAHATEGKTKNPPEIKSQSADYSAIPVWVMRQGSTSKKFTKEKLVAHMPIEVQNIDEGSVGVDETQGIVKSDQGIGWEFIPLKDTRGIVPIRYKSSGKEHVGAYIQVWTDLTGPVCSGNGLCIWVPIVALILALVLVFIGRYLWVVEPKNAHLRAQYRLLQARLISDDSLGDARETAIKKLLDAVLSDDQETKGLIPSEKEWPRGRMLFAFTGKQLEAWRLLHEAERLLFEANPDPVVQGQAIVALSKLDRLVDSPRKLRRELTKALHTAADLTPSSELDRQHLVSLLKEAKALIFEAEDRLFETAATAQNKAFWLILAAFSSVLAIGLVFIGSPVLLLTGAIGGLLARLRKAIKQQATVFDYGVSWGVLFLTPFTGALSGWIGVALLAMMQDWQFLSVDRLHIALFSANIYTVIAALIFGLSATLFDTFVEKFEAAVSLGEKPEPYEDEIEIMATEEEAEKAKSRSLGLLQKPDKGGKAAENASKGPGSAPGNLPQD